jgi:chromosome transmission fidelity protein 1
MVNLLPTEKGDRRCQFLPPLDDETRILDFRDQILVSIRFHVGLTSLTCKPRLLRKILKTSQWLVEWHKLVLISARDELFHKPRYSFSYILLYI